MYFVYSEETVAGELRNRPKYESSVKFNTKFKIAELFQNGNPLHKDMMFIL